MSNNKPVYVPWFRKADFFKNDYIMPRRDKLPKLSGAVEYGKATKVVLTPGYPEYSSDPDRFTYTITWHFKTRPDGSKPRPIMRDHKGGSLRRRSKSDDNGPLGLQVKIEGV